MTSLSLRNPIAILMLCVGVIVFAMVVTPRMSIDTFPELTPPVLIVGEAAPGLAAKDVEKAVAWRIERYVAATPGVDHVESLSRNNFALIYVWLKWGVNLGAAQTLVQSEAQFAMAGAPKSLGLLPPFVLQYDPSNAPVCQVVITGSGYTSSQLYDYAQNHVEPMIEGIDGVGSAPVDGGRPRQINVVVDPVKALARHITAEDVAAAVSRANALLPSGEFIAPKFDANVYTNGVPKNVADIGDGIVKLVDGRPVRLKDVARVEDGGMPQTQVVSVGGRDAVGLNVLRIPGGNTIQIVDAVKDKVAHLSLPAGMHAAVYFDQSTFVRTTFAGLKREILQAMVLIALVILVFLQSVRGTLIVSVAIPLAFAVTLIILYASGQTLNAFTLGGLTLAMGLLVDSSVVVLESIHRFRRGGMSAEDAARAGADAVALPMLAASLATVAVLLPVLLLAGLAKRLFAPLALTVAAAMIVAYFVSLAVTPVVCRYFLGHDEPGRLARLFERAVTYVADGYRATLRRVLTARPAVVLASFALIASSVWMATRLPTTFFPEIDESMETIFVRFAPGISVKEAGVELTAMGAALERELPPGTIRMIVTNNGMPEEQRSLLASPNVAPNTGFLRLAFASPEERKLSQGEIAVAARTILTREFPGVEVLQDPGGLVASVFANGYTAPLVVEIENDDLVQLDAAARAVAAVAQTVPGVRDVKESMQMDYPEVRVDTDRERAGLVGSSLRDAAQATLEATTGNINTPGVWVDANNGRAYYVVTYYDGNVVSDTQALGGLPLHFSRDKRPVLLGAYANVHRGVGAVSVERSRMQRVAHVLMQTERRDLGSAASELERRLRADPRTRDVRFHFVGQVDLMRTTFSGLGVALALAIMVVFMIMASQFRSLRLPLVMLFTIPVALFGIVLALLAAGQGFSISALMGVLMVIGIAVSNGILLVDDANRRLLEGGPPLESVIEAARSRFVPILMTSLATIIGLVPTAMALEHGSEANQPLALAVVGGLASSTVISLFLVPVMFLFFAKRSGERAPGETPHV
ncbi:MAG TPA: efflux RND transporter permease subunit [Polyangia bacterium]|nr:efflux RND transporter permease subunit [Polyangia bacterium]